MNCKRCGALAEPSCQPEYYRWSTDRTNGTVDYIGSGLCSACFQKDARRAGYQAHVPICPYCGADIAGRMDIHTSACRYKGILVAEAIERRIAGR
jgi:hypothetical protein